MRIWKSRTDQPYECAKAFLFKIARHVAIDLLRRNRASPIDAVSDLGVLTATEDRPGEAAAVSSEERIRILVQGLRTLPPHGRDVVVLRKFEGLSQRQAAAKLGIAEKTVEEHLYRGLKRLGAYLRKHGVTDLYDR